MSTIETVEELDALPAGSVVLSRAGVAYTRLPADGGWGTYFGDPRPSGLMLSPVMVSQPLTLVHNPAAPLDLPALVSAEREADRLALAAAREEVGRLAARLGALPGEIEMWRKESSDVLVEGAWSDGVRFGLAAAISIVRGDV